MASYHARRGMNALSEIVLNTAADPTRADSWVGQPLGLSGAGVRIERTGDGLRIEWDPAGGPRGSGELTVREDGAGATDADLRVRCEAAEPDPARRMLDALAEEVDQNFTAG